MHIVNGESAAGNLRAALALASDQVLVCNDVLSLGAVPDVDLVKNWPAWVEARQAYWQAQQALAKLGYDEGSDEGFADFPRDLYHYKQSLLQATRLDVWTGQSISDQLLLIFIAYLKNMFALEATIYWHDFSCIPYEANDAEPQNQLRVLGLGQLSPQQIASYQSEQTLSLKQEQALVAIWQIYSENNEQAISHILNDGLSLSTTMEQGIQALLQRDPNQRKDDNSGLRYWDLALLSNIQRLGEEPVIAAKAVGETLGSAMQGYDLTGDLYLFARVAAMAKAKHPLILQSFSDASSMRSQLSLTPLAKQILKGECAYPEISALTHDE